MAKKIIHYQSAKYYKIKYLRSYVVAAIVVLLTLFPMMLMARNGGSWVLTIIIMAILVGFFALQIRTNYVLWKEKEDEEAPFRKKVHKRAPIRR